MNMSILHEVLPIVNDKTMVLNDKKHITIKHVLSNCKDEESKFKMIEQIAAQRSSRLLQQLVYNLILKFEGVGLTGGR